MQAVKAECHQGIGGGVGHDPLAVAHDLAAHVARVPVDGALPDDVRQHVHQAGRQVCTQATSHG